MAPYQLTADNLQVLQLRKDRIKILEEIQNLEGQDSSKVEELHKLYETYLKAEKQASVESISANPYFDKYDVAGDSRNIARELRSVVHEDIVDRGVNESKKLLGRAFESRWMQEDSIIAKRLNTLGRYYG